MNKVFIKGHEDIQYVIPFMTPSLFFIVCRGHEVRPTWSSFCLVLVFSFHTFNMVFLYVPMSLLWFSSTN